MPQSNRTAALQMAANCGALEALKEFLKEGLTSMLKALV